MAWSSGVVSHFFESQLVLEFLASHSCSTYLHVREFHHELGKQAIKLSPLSLLIERDKILLHIEDLGFFLSDRAVVIEPDPDALVRSIGWFIERCDVSRDYQQLT